MVALQAGIVPDTARTIDRAKCDENRGSYATLCPHLFAPDPDSFLAGQGLQHQTAAVSGRYPIYRRQPARQNQMIDDPDTQPGGCDLVRPQGRFDPHFLPDPEFQPHARQRAAISLDESGESQRGKGTTFEPGRDDGLKVTSSDRAARRHPANGFEVIEMAGKIARQRQHGLDHRQAASGGGKMRTRRYRDRFVSVNLRKFSQIKSMQGLGKGALRPGSKPHNIECQPVTQQLKPHLLARPNGVGLSVRCGRRLMTEIDCRMMRDKVSDGIAIRPLAGGKQQMQFRGIAVLRPSNCSDPLVRNFPSTHCVVGFCKHLILRSTHQ